MSDVKSVKKAILETGKLKNLDDISRSIPFAPCYIGPGKWIKALKDLYALKNRGNDQIH
ncbi:MAG: hypothetical protein RBT69_02220 [Spirochaetia bacterium]|jgi:hypothetical protein|nr:hypothetical protein [Spirochaetia bacterium]